jgi:aminopeptidase N
MHDLFASWERAGAGDLSSFTHNWLRTAGPDVLRFDRTSGVVRRTPPAAHPADREHTVQVAMATPGSPWRICPVTTSGAETPLVAGSDEAVVIDPFEDTWAVVEPDETTVRSLPRLLPATGDAMIRAGVWNGIRSAFHNASLSPATALDLVEAAIPVEDNDDALTWVLPWARREAAALSDDPSPSLGRVHRATLARLDTAEPGSTVQLASFQSTISSATDATELRAWLDGADVPAGAAVDLDLRWRILIRLATMGEIDRSELQTHLDAEPTARSRVEHACAVASLPDAEAKAWAWARFLGDEVVPNYEVEASGIGMWRVGHEHLTERYVDRYFDELPGREKVFSGWLLARVAEWYFPTTSLRDETLAKAHALTSRDDLDRSLRRRVIDETDDLRRRIAVRRAFGRPLEQP